MTNKEQLILNIDNNYKTFQEKQLQTSTKEVFANSTKIHYYCNIHTFATGYASRLSDEHADFLLTKGDGVIDYLYGTDCDLSMFDTFKGFSALIENEIADTNFKTNTVSKLKTNAAKNFEEFKNSMLQKDNREIFASAHKINFYTILSDYFDSDVEFSTETASVLFKDEEKVLDFLYDYYIDYQCSFRVS